MIDTIILTLHKTAFTITDPSLFTPNAHWALGNFRFSKHRASKQSPTKAELKKGIYKPRLMLYQKNAAGPLLRIELSLPKLFFGNNFSELQYKDFGQMVKKLIIILDKMGIQITSKALQEAPVSAIHYAKNIVLTDGSIPYHYIQKIKEANLKLYLDTNQTDYRNEGHAYKWHTNSYEVVFYDKIKDLEKAQTRKKRVLEKDNALQLTLLGPFKKRKKFEVLRMEVRLNTRKKLAQLFKKLGINTSTTFKKLFKPALSKKILLHYLEEIESRRPLLLDYHASGKDLLANLVFNNPNTPPRKILHFFGLKHALTLYDMRELRILFAKHTPRTWYNLIVEMQKIQLPSSHNPLKELKKQIALFKPLRLKNP